MGIKSFKFESKKEKRIFVGVVAGLVIIGIIGAILFYPAMAVKINKSPMGGLTGRATLDASKTPKDYYAMFKCPCCGKPIDADCCDMSKQRKDYVDNLLLEGTEGNELVYRMVKMFGSGVLMDPSQEQEVKDYIKSQAPENPPKIIIEPLSYNFGTISQADGIVSTAFAIRNAGGSDLIIEKIDTSCMCTSASLIYNGKESQRFSMSMHSTSQQTLDVKIPPGESAQLKVYYDPNAHGKQKTLKERIIRTVSIISNDPSSFQKEVRVEVTQIP